MISQLAELKMMTAKTFRSMVLLTAAIGVGSIGVAYLFVPQAILGLYGITIQSVNEASILRSACGGVFIVFSTLFVLGAVKEELSFTAVVALAAFMGGFAIGRIASIVADGVPSPILLALAAIEVTYTGCALYLLSNQDAHNNSLQGRRP